MFFFVVVGGGGGGGVRESGLEKGASVIRVVSYQRGLSLVFHQDGLLCGLSSGWSHSGLSSG